MLRHVLITFGIFSLIFLNNPIQSLGEYYWRDWNGTAPSDGFVVGSNSNQPIYIVQAFLHNYGLYVGYVTEGQVSVSLNFGTFNGTTIHRSTVLKVLCAENSTDLYWMSVDSETLGVILEYYLPLIGGINSSDDDDIRVIQIGRSVSAQNSFIGGVHKDLRLYYNDGSIGSTVDEFDILLRNV